MKVTDLNEIRDEIIDQLSDEEWKILEYLTFDQSILVVLNIYNTNDFVKAFGQDIEDSISIISNNRRISAIHGSHASYWKTDTDICEYNNLQEDIASILIVLEAAINRMEAFV